MYVYNAIVIMVVISVKQMNFIFNYTYLYV